MEMMSTPFNPRPRELDPVEGVNWGNQATLRLVSGPTYQNLELVTDILDPADIERVTLKLNGKEIIGLSGQDLVDFQEHRKQFTEKGRYVVPFSDLTLRTKAGVRTGELVTLQGEIWMVYIQLKAKDAGTQAPSIRARAHTTAAQSRRVYLPRLYSLTWYAAVAGRTPFDFAERSPFLSIKRIHFKDNTIERVRVMRDEREEINVAKADNAFDLAVAGLEQNQDWFTLDFVRTGFGVEGRLPTNALKQLQFELDKTSQGSVPVIVEAIEQVGEIAPKA
ncbi:putative major phage capsid protein [Vibrio sinaloensis DSM 21326]|uniref:Putative major phage capsid protein n=1 Tax=Vibrio sinaloensis DSM 21326 TaxID=945550 RepID=E8M8N7_PHOS4|nr:major capsid protein P2 [Vibrio sinaloensis]EGA69582.1 putative major phage capsid protein [Vibrio sinaloensis DSM 21326]